MNKKERNLMRLAVIVLSLIGGGFWGRFFTVQPARASEVGLSAGSALAPAVTDEDVLAILRTENLQLVDKEGKLRASLSASSNESSVALTLSTIKGRTCMILHGSYEGYPGLLFSGEGGTLAELSFETSGMPSLALSDAQGKIRNLLRLEPDGNALLAMQDDKRIARVLFGRVTPATAGASKELPLASLVLCGQDEKIIWKAP